MTLDTILRQRARRTPERLAYLFLEEGETESARLTWADLDRRACVIAGALRRRCAVGDRALLLYPPGLEFIAAFFGCLYAGVVAVPAYPPRPRRGRSRLLAILDDASPCVALTTGALLTGAFRTALEPELERLGWIATDLLDTEPAGGPRSETDPAAPAFLQYTSGSTALPKGVIVSHGNLLHNERMIQAAFGQDEHSVVVGWLPLYHDMGLIGNVLQPLYSGGSCVLMAPMAFLQRPRRWLEAISRHQATTSGGPNFAYELCVQSLGPAERQGLDLSSWTVAFNGAEPVRAETLDRFAEAFAPCGFSRRAFFPCYGLAEGTLLVTGGRRGMEAPRAVLSTAALERHEVAPVSATDRAARQLVSCGHPYLEQRVAIVDTETFVPCPPDRVGEIWVCGPSVAGGYWGRPEATSSDFGARLAGGEGPYLRTGDLGFQREGELYITGRLKDLIILRGRNHYPQDLELTVERSHPALRPGCGAAFAIEAGGEERLVVVYERERHAAAAMEELAGTVRRALAEEHEVQLEDLVLIRPGSLPKTSSGKVQRHSCRALYLSGDLSVVGRSCLGGAPGAAERESGLPPGGASAAPEPGSEDRRLPAVEAFLRSTLARVARTEVAHIDREQAMSAVGLDSLAAVELRNAIASELGTAPSVAEILEGISLAETARQVLRGAEARGGPAPPVIPGSDSEEFPLSQGQKALWILFGLDPESAAYNIAGAARLAGGVDPAALRRAFQCLMDRHAALRTTFAEGLDGPVQRIHPRMPVAFVQEDASGWSAEELLCRMREEAFRPFDLERGPVMRSALFERGPEGSLLVLSVHHIAADFWSLAILVRELGELYTGAETVLAPVAPAGWHRSLVHRESRMWANGEGQELVERAREQLARTEPLDFPTDWPRPPLQRYRGALQSGRLGRGLADEVRALARRNGVTTFMVLLAGFEAFLARYSGQESFLVGTPTSGRWSRELEGEVGYLVNPVPLRADLSSAPDVREWLARTRRSALDAFARQEIPFALLAERLGQQRRDPSRPALVQAMLVLQRAPTPELAALAAFALDEGGALLRLRGLTLESVALKPASAQFDLTLLAAELEGDLAAALQFNTDLFDGVTAQRMLGHFANLLRAMTRSEPQLLSELDLLSESEERQILIEWNSTAVAYPGAACLHELIAAQVEKTPEALALVFEAESLNYRELNARANQLAHHLQRLGVGPDVLVGVSLERSTELVVGLLAVLKAGGAYVPIDAAYPAERRGYMLADSRVPVLLVHEEGAQAPPDGARVVAMDGLQPWRHGGDPGNPTSGVEADNLAYLVYTSGSTGRPKGAMNSHRAVVNRLLWGQDIFRLTPRDRVLQKTPISFDVSVWELFWPLLSGACLEMARPGGHQDPSYLIEAIAARAVTTVHFVPSLLQVFLDHPEVERCARLRRVIASGEALTPALAAAFQGRLGRFGIELYNLYGPTEAAIEVTGWRCLPEEDRRSVPIGRPVANTRVHGLDRNLGAVPIGVTGELYLGGVQLARGYWQRPDLTAERFLPDPFAGEPGARLYRTGDLVRYKPGGELEYLGRTDHQVKIRGVRIELSDVELALVSHPAVREAVVAARAGVQGDRLIAYVVPVPGAEPDVESLRIHLRERLPEAMVPGAWVFLAGLPLSLSGKVDRKALPEPEPASLGRDCAPPRTSAEKALVDIWCQVLQLERVGVHDNFFALGGDSILSMQLLWRSARAGLRLTARQVFQYPTIAELAAVAQGIEAAEAEPEGVAGAEVPLTPIQHWFFEQSLPNPHHWNWAASRLLTLDEVPPCGLLERALDALLRHHDALRLRFFSEAGGWRQRYSREEDEGPPCTRLDLSAVPAGDQRAALVAAAAAAQRSLDLSRGPLLRAVLFQLDPGGPGRLLLVLHHLVVDGISWHILLEDLETACRQLLGGRAIDLPARTASFGRWARQLAAHAASADVQREAEYWLAVGREAERLPVDFPGRQDRNLESSARVVHRALDSEATRALLYEIHDAYRTRIDDVLQTALVRAFGRWTGRRSLLVDLESHGRHELFPDLDVSRTVGWLTALYRVRLDLSAARGPGESLSAIKEQRRRIPASGAGYGILRYLTGSETCDGLREPRSEVLFNYLGQARSGGPAPPLFKPAPEPGGPVADPGGRRSHVLIVNGWVAGGRLEMEWSYSEELHRCATVESLADGFLGELRDLIAHCKEPQAGAYSASDFPAAELSDRELGKLLGKLNRSPRGVAR